MKFKSLQVFRIAVTLFRSIMSFHIPASPGSLLASSSSISTAFPDTSTTSCTIIRSNPTNNRTRVSTVAESFILDIPNLKTDFFIMENARDLELYKVNGKYLTLVNERLLIDFFVLALFNFQRTLSDQEVLRPIFLL